MKLALATNCWEDEDLMYAQQFGVTHALATMAPDADAEAWQPASLAAVRNRVEKAGLELAGIASLPSPSDQLVLGKSGRDAEVEEICGFIRNVGAAGIPLVGYCWTPADWRIDRLSQGRGGAHISSYVQNRAQEVPLVCTHEQMWEHLSYFLERVIPVAEKAGVKMACHPDDPPVASAGGVPRVLNSVEGLTRLLEIAPSPCHGLDFCQGTVATMPDTDLLETIRLFGQRQKIFMVRLSNPREKLPSFAEAFMDEGDTDMVQALRTYLEVGFDGTLRPAPSPEVLGDTEWGHKGQAFAVGYLRALLQALEHATRG